MGCSRSRGTAACGCCLPCLQRNRLQDTAQAARLDWGEPLPADLQLPYDIVLCSDVVYSPASVRPLLSSISALTGPSSTVLYACEFREGAGLELLHQLLPQYHLKEQLVSQQGWGHVAVWWHVPCAWAVLCCARLRC